MIRNINGTIVVQRHNYYVIVDCINPQILAARMLNAGYSEAFSDIVAYKGGIQTTKDAIELGKRCGKISPMLTESSNTIKDKVVATQQRIQEEIQKYIERMVKLQ